VVNLELLLTGEARICISLNTNRVTIAFTVKVNKLDSKRACYKLASSHSHYFCLIINGNPGFPIRLLQHYWIQNTKYGTKCVSEERNPTSNSGSAQELLVPMPISLTVTVTLPKIMCSQLKLKIAQC